MQWPVSLGSEHHYRLSLPWEGLGFEVHSSLQWIPSEVTKHRQMLRKLEVMSSAPLACPKLGWQERSSVPLHTIKTEFKGYF